MKSFAAKIIFVSMFLSLFLFADASKESVDAVLSQDVKKLRNCFGKKIF
jgi:hypothetical protein